MPDDIDFSAYYDNVAEQDDRANVKPAESYLGVMAEHYHGDHADLGLRLPWPKTFDLVRFRPAEVSLWSGFSGSGKSVLLGQVEMCLAAQGSKGCLASLEMKPHSSLNRMTRQFIMKRTPDLADRDDFHFWTRDKLWLYDSLGMSTPKKVLGVVTYCFKELGIKQFFLDSLMKCGIPEDDFTGQGRFIDALVALAHDYNAHVHIVAHAKKKEDESKVPGKMDVRGGAIITDQVDNIFIVWKNKPKISALEAGSKDEKWVREPDAILLVDKQRNGEEEPKFKLWFDRDTFQFLPDTTGKLIDFAEWGA